MGTYSEKFFDVQYTTDFFGKIYEAFEEYKTYAQEHYASIDDFSTTENWKGVDADEGKELLATDVYNILTSIIDMQDTLVELQEGILSGFSSDVDAATNAKIKVGILEKIKSNFAAFYSKLDYYATREEDMVEHLNTAYSKKYNVTFTAVDYVNDRKNFTDFCGLDEADESGFLYDCMQKLINFDSKTLGELQEQKLALAITEISTSMKMDTYNVSLYDCSTIRRNLGEIAGEDYYTDEAKPVKASKGASEPTWLEQRGMELISVLSGDLSHKEYYQHGVKMFDDDVEKNGIRKYFESIERKISSGFISGKGDEYDVFKEYNEKHTNQKERNLHYVDTGDEVHKGKGEIGKDANGEDDDTYARDKFNKKLYTLGEIGYDSSHEVSWRDVHGKLGGDNTYIEGDLKVGTAEEHHGVHVGVYRYETTASGETKKIFCPEVNAEVGASCAAIDASVDGRLGTEEVGLYGKGNVRALSAEGSAEASFNGHEAHVSASAEADLVKASGSVGVDYLGVKAGVNGSVKIGIGAHADIGVTDGVFKCEIGAALGVGVDVGFEIDAGSAIEAVSDAAKSAWDDAGDFFEGAKDAWNAWLS